MLQFIAQNWYWLLPCYILLGFFYCVALPGSNEKWHVVVLTIILWPFVFVAKLLAKISS